MATITYIVKVASGKFTIDDAVAPKLTFRDGDTYVFDQADNSNSGHILQFSATSNNSGSSEYTTGVTKTGTAGSSGAKTTIVTSGSTTDTLYYYSSGGGTHGSEFSNSGFKTSANYNVLKPIVGSSTTEEKWGPMVNHAIDQFDTQIATLTGDTVSSSSGGTFSGNVSLGNNNITNVGSITSTNLSLTPGSAPGSPSEGQLYYDSTFDALLVYSNSTWNFAESGHKATGGQISYYNDGSTNWVIHHFLNHDSKFKILANTVCDILVVAGGGSAGYGAYSGAGGGGGVRYWDDTTVAAGIHTILVGAGGQNPGAERGSPGGQSKFGTLTTVEGGGGGGNYGGGSNVVQYTGATGGSGGGGGCSSWSGDVAGGEGTVDADNYTQGYAGERGYGNGDNSYGGAGGGAGAQATHDWRGGYGKKEGETADYGDGSKVIAMDGKGRYFGGGGAGWVGRYNNAVGRRGKGGGGAGGTQSDVEDQHIKPTDGLDGYGGGAGGGTMNEEQNAACHGGSGTIMVRYQA